MAHPLSEVEIIYNQQNQGIGAAAGRKGKKPQTEEAITQEKMEEKIYQLARKSSQVLFQTRTVFPFDFFPDTLTVTANKIDVVSSAFFLSHQTTSIPLADIANVEIQTSPFFATLQIINIRYPMHPLILNYLKINDAQKAKKIIDGLLVAVAQGTDVTKIEPANFIKQIEKVGESGVEE
jgi:hypothetical protein